MSKMGRPQGARNKQPIQREIVLALLKNKEAVTPSEIDEALNRQGIASHIIAQIRGLGYKVESVRDGLHVVSYRYLSDGTAKPEPPRGGNPANLEMIRSVAEKFASPVMDHHQPEHFNFRGKVPTEPELDGVLKFK